MPGDNPCLDDAGTDDDISAKGIRNSQGLAIHLDTGELWANDHGPDGGHKINRVETA